MNDRYALLLEPDTFINLIHEKFGVETFDSHSVSVAVDSSDPVVLLSLLPMIAEKSSNIETFSYYIRHEAGHEWP